MKVKATMIVNDFTVNFFKKKKKLKDTIITNDGHNV